MRTKDRTPKPFTKQKIQAMQRKLHKEISELQSLAEQSLNEAKRKFQKGFVSAADFDAFTSKLEEWRDLEIEKLRDEHRKAMRHSMLSEVYWGAKKVPMTETGCKSIDEETKKEIGWPWTEAQIAEHGAKTQAQKDSDELAEQLLQKCHEKLPLVKRALYLKDKAEVMSEVQ